MNQNIRNNHSQIDRGTNACIISATLLLIAVMVKLFYIFYMTMRGNEHPYPYDTYVFNTPDRFVDYLITQMWAKEVNPWDPNHPLLKEIISAPYGPLSFYYIKFLKFISPLQQFMILIIGYIFICYKLISDFFEASQQSIKILVFLALMVGYYPLHFIVDRGNIEILPAVFFSAILLFAPKKKINPIILDFFIIIIASCKFTWLPILSLTLFFPIRRAAFILTTVFLVYLYPIVFKGASVSGYISTIVSSYKVSGWALNFSHNVFHAVQMIGEFVGRPISDKYVFISAIIGAVFILAPYVVLLRDRLFGRKVEENMIYLFLCHLALCTLIFANPSFDYRLIYLLPIFLFLMGLVSSAGNSIGISSANLNCLIVSFCLSACWFNFYVGPSSYSWYMPIRSVSIITFDISLLFLMYRIYKHSNASRVANGE